MTPAVRIRLSPRLGRRYEILPEPVALPDLRRAIREVAGPGLWEPEEGEALARAIVERDHVAAQDPAFHLGLIVELIA